MAIMMLEGLSELLGLSHHGGDCTCRGRLILLVGLVRDWSGKGLRWKNATLGIGIY